MRQNIYKNDWIKDHKPGLLFEHYYAGDRVTTLDHNSGKLIKQRYTR
jgi:hypothetical protein